MSSSRPAGPTGASRPATRRVPLLTALILLAVLLPGVRRVAPSTGHFTLRIWSPAPGAARAVSGWTWCPPLLCRLADFPARTELTLRVGNADGTAAEVALRSREGAALMAAGRCLLEPDPDAASRLAAAFPAGWGDDAAAVLAEAIREPLAREAAARGFVDLVADEGLASRSGQDGPAQRIGKLGVRLDPSSRLRYYPAPEPPGGAAGRSAPRRRVLMIGLDGADWEIIDPLMAAGRMPNMRKLVESGVRARLRTITPVLSPIIWTSMATGVGPDRHGIVDFLATSRTTGNQIPVTSNMRRVKALWNILSDRGLSSGVVAWWATWPAEQVNGFIVSDRVAYQLFGYPDAGQSLRRRTYPESLGLAIQPLIVAPSEITDAEAARFIAESAQIPRGDELVERLKTILASSKTYVGVGMDLMRAYDPDFKAIYLEGTDTVAHNFMRYRPPRMAGVTEAEMAAYGEVVDRYYEYTDEQLGRILAAAGDDTAVILCSDHGFRNGSNRPATDPRIEMGGAADWHRRFGVLAISGPGIRRGSVLEDASVLDITPTVLALMGLPVAGDMTGRPLREAFETPPVADTIATYETGGEPAGNESNEPVGSALDDEIVARLTALGYVSQEGTNALNNTGITLIDRGRYSEAAEVFRKAIRKEPRFLHARINLGRALMLMKDFDGAVKALEDALSLDPAQADVHNLLGNIHMERGDTAAAEAEFRKCLGIHPDSTDAHNSLGLLYDRTGRVDQAIEEYRKVVAIDPDYAEGYNNIGLIHRKRGEPLKAIEMFEKAIRSDPDFPGSYNNMGLAYQDLGRLGEARAAFERGLGVDPSNAVILNNLGALDLAEKRLEQAKARFEEAIRSDPDYPSAYNNLGAVFGMLGQPENAFEQYLKSVEIDPNYTDGRFNLARAFIEKGKPAEAIAMLEKVLAIDPDYGRAHLQLGMILAQQGDLEGAVKRLHEAVRTLPDSPDPHNLLAEIHMRNGRTDAARREIAVSLALRPDQPQVRQMMQKITGAAPGGSPDAP